MSNEPAALTQADILGILQDANSVPLGQPIFNSSEEYNKLKAIIESAICYTHPVNPYQSITDTKIEPTVVSYTHPVKEYFEDEPQAEELHEILQSNASPVKELTLTEDEIDDVWAACSTGESEFIDMHLFAEAILRKASEK